MSRILSRTLSRSLILFSFFMFVSGAASAAGLQAELNYCRGIQSLALRLQCYDRLVDGVPRISESSTVRSSESVKSPESPSVSTTIPSTATPSVAAPTVAAPSKQVVTKSTPAPKIKPEELFGKSQADVDKAVNRKLEIENVDQISSQVTRIQINSSKEYVVYLENGQVWRQKDKPGKWRIKVGETAIISKAYLGSYLMKSDARKKSVRAERIR
jgi:hypothetical protein